MLLKDETIGLVSFEPTHSHQYLKWVNSGEFASLLGRCLPVTQQEHEAWYRSQVGNSNSVFFAVEELPRQSYLGNVWLHNIHWVNRNAELRILLGAEGARGKGYGTRACQLLVRFAFEKLGLRKVYLYVSALNPGAERAFVKAGFSEEAVLREEFFLDGNFVDVKRLACFCDDAKVSPTA